MEGKPQLTARERIPPAPNIRLCMVLLEAIQVTSLTSDARARWAAVFDKRKKGATFSKARDGPQGRANRKEIESEREKSKFALPALVSHSDKTRKKNASHKRAAQPPEETGCSQNGQQSSRYGEVRMRKYNLHTRNNLFIPWMLTHKGMHATNGNTTNKLSRELRNLQSALDGEAMNLTSYEGRSTTKKPATAPKFQDDDINDSDEEFYTPVLSKKAKKRRNRKFRESQHASDNQSIAPRPPAPKRQQPSRPTDRTEEERRLDKLLRSLTSGSGLDGSGVSAFANGERQRRQTKQNLADTDADEEEGLDEIFVDPEHPPEQSNQSPKKPKKSRRRRKGDKNNNTNNDTAAQATETTIWDPNTKQTIKIIQQNRRGEKLQSDEVKRLERDYIKTNIAISVHTETRTRKEEEPFLTMENYASYFNSATKETRDEHLQRLKDQIREKGEEEGADQEQIELLIEQQENRASQGMDSVIHGIAIYLHRYIFPATKVVSESLNHIAVHAKDLNNNIHLFVAVYGPPESATANNLFYRETLTQLIEAYDNTHNILLMGDFNAHADLSKDVKIGNRSTKTALQDMRLGSNLTDIRRNLQMGPDIFTFQRGDDEHLANLDYYIGNRKMMTFLDRRKPEITMEDIPPPGKDHIPMTLEFKLKTNKVKTIPKQRFKRTLEESQVKELADIIDKIEMGDHNRENLSKVTEAIRKYQKENLELYPTQQTPVITPAQKKATQAHQAATLVHRIARLTLKLKPRDTDQIRIGEKPNASDRSLQARIKRDLYRLRRDHPEFYVTPHNPIHQWTKTMNEKLKKASNRKKYYLNKDRRHVIAQRVQGLIDSGATNPRLFYKKMKRSLNPDSGSLEAVYTDEERKNVSGDPEDCEKAVKQFYQSLYATRGDNSNEITEWLHKKSPTPQSMQKAEAPISIEEIKEQISGLANNKATGSDEIPAEIYKLLLNSEKFINALHGTMSDIIEKGEKMPDAWREANMILLFKAGDKNDVANYRPISLVQIIYKVHSSVLVKRLLDFIIENNFLVDTQNGFRPERGTAHKLVAIRLAMENALIQKAERHILSLDLKKAFDSIEHWLIREAMGENGLGVPPRLRNAIMDTLHDASIRVQLPKVKTDRIPVSRGVRQGDPLSSILFLIAIDPLLRKLNELSTNTDEPTLGPHAFADDIEVITESSEKLEEAWEVICRYMKVTNVEINVKKSLYVRNLQAHQNGNQARLTLDGETIPELNKNAPFKILGVQFTTELSWEHHRRIIKGKIIGMAKHYAKKKITDIQFIDVINTVLMAMLAYGMSIVPYTNHALQEIKDTLKMIVCRRLRLKEPKGLDEALHLKRELGGLGLYDIKEVHDAAQINAFMSVLRGHDCPGKRALIHQRAEYGAGNIEELPCYTLWQDMRINLGKHRASIHSVNQHPTKAVLKQLVEDSRTLGTIHQTLVEKTESSEIRDPMETLFSINHRLVAPAEPATFKDNIESNTTIKLSQEQVEQIRLALIEAQEQFKPFTRSTLQKALGAPGSSFDIPLIELVATNQWDTIRLAEWLTIETIIPVTIKDREQIDEALEPFEKLEDAQYDELRRIADQFSPGTKLSQPYLGRNISTDQTENTHAPRHHQTRSANNRAAEFSWNNIEYEIQWTDGSCRTEDDGTVYASWGLYSPKRTEDVCDHFRIRQTTRANIPSVMFQQRVEGEQSNTRAELFGILAALEKKKSSNNNQLIVTDSQYAIDEIQSWPNRTLKERNRTLDADVLKLIHELLGNSNRRTDFLHIYSHQENADAERQDKIKAQKEKYRLTEENYQILVMGNEMADKAASIKSREPPKGARNWESNPMQGTPDHYIVKKAVLRDGKIIKPQTSYNGPIHKWIRSEGQDKILRTWGKDRAKLQEGDVVKSKKAFEMERRRNFIRHLDTCDKKRTFASAKKKHPKHHHVYTALFRLRTHEHPTISRCNRFGRSRKRGKTYRNYYAAMYPDNLCHFCKKSNVNVEETSEHMLNCPNRPANNDKREALWDRIYNKIRDSQKEGSAKNPLLLKPWAMSNQQLLDNHTAALSGGRLPRNLAEVATYNGNLADLGFIPSHLRSALLELDVRTEAVDGLAEEVALLVQSAIVENLHERARTIHNDRDQKKLYRQHVLGPQ